LGGIIFYALMRNLLFYVPWRNLLFYVPWRNLFYALCAILRDSDFRHGQAL